ncbi:MAG TPA: glycosyltransferase family 2 protein [Terriglobales bacterium]|nr:glycosyltransferase family 2 protein [Terriglobales bacterium]
MSVIIPARNEAASLGACLASIVGQEDVDFEVIVVDDQSTDATASIARSSPQVRLIQAGDLPEGWVGKNHAVWLGAQAAAGQWLLFTDADTVHRPGSLRRSLDEAKEYGADLLSYSPEQEVHGFWERALMPVVFAELTRTYRTVDVNDPASPTAAANGQYLLIRRDVYDWIGGHATIAGALLEDVQIAKRVKRSGRTIRFRYGGDAVRTRMYRNFGQMWEGWSKNLAVLFPHPIRLALIRGLEFLLLLGVLSVLLAGMLVGTRAFVYLGIFGILTFGTDFLRRILRAHFGLLNTLLSVFGLPIFAVLLVNSTVNYRRKKKVAWKGRTYPTSSFASGDRSQSESGLAAGKQ